MRTTRELTGLEQLQQAQIEALQKRNAYLENELKQAKQLFQDIVNDWEVVDAEEVNPNLLDKMFDNPIEQINNFL